MTIFHRYAGRPPAVFLLVLALWLAAGAGTVRAAGRQVFVIPIAGTVDPGMAAFVERALDTAGEHPEALCVLEIDTFGGRVDAALAIVDALIADPPRRTLAYVATQAISAGALIALACDRLVMRAGTTIGDCAPIAYSNEGPTELGEKFQSPLRARFRALARRNGYPVALAESMVSADMTVYAVTTAGTTRYLDQHAYDDLSPEEKQAVSSRRTVVAAGELLTMDATEARELGFSRATATSLEAALEQLGIVDAAVTRIEESWSEAFVRLIGTISPFLLMIGLGALYTELKAPGFGVFGIIGIVCLGLVFLNQYLVGLADYTELLVLVLGIVLLGFELFVIPGFGIAGIAGLLCIAAGAVLALQDFVIPDPAMPWQAEILGRNLRQVLTAICLALIGSLLALRYLLPRVSTLVAGPVLNTTLARSQAAPADIRPVRAGDTGEARTALRPAGKMAFGNDVIDVISEGEFIAAGAALTVTAVAGNRVIVARTAPHD